jgi:hypothetical protein
MDEEEVEETIGAYQVQAAQLTEKILELESKLHQLSEDHSHCEDLLHELGARASSAETRLSSAVLWHSFAAEGAPTTPGRYLVAYVAEGFDHLCVTDEALEDFDFVEPVYWAEFKLPVVETHAKGCTRPRPHSGPCDDGIGELAPAVETWSLGRSDVKEAYENYKPPTLESTGGVWKFDVENRDHKSERKTFRDPAKTAVESQKQFGSSRWDRPEVKAEEAEKTAAMRGRVDALLDATCEHGKKVREWCDDCEKALGRV